MVEEICKGDQRSCTLCSISSCTAVDLSDAAHVPVVSQGVLMVREDTMAAAHRQSCHEAATPVLQQAAQLSTGPEPGRVEQAVLTKVVQQWLCCLPGGLQFQRCVCSGIHGMLHLCMHAQSWGCNAGVSSCGHTCSSLMASAGHVPSRGSVAGSVWR